MAATVVLCESNTAGETETQDIDNVNMGSVDETEIVPADHPLTAKADGHSFEKWLRLYCSDLGGSSQIDNLKVWLSGLGGGWKQSESMSTSLKEAAYVDPAFNGGGPIDTDSADAINAMPEAEPGGANLGIGGVLNGIIDTPPAYSDYMVLQLNVLADSPPGNVNQKTLTAQWDEM